MLDAPDPRTLGRFYAELLSWTIWSEDAEGCALDAGEGVAYLSIQRNVDYQPPTWPAPAGTQQMMVHLDFEVSDLAASVDHAVELGAQLAEHQPQQHVRVLLDPVGHPFCLYSDHEAQ